MEVVKLVVAVEQDHGLQTVHEFSHEAPVEKLTFENADQRKAFMQNTIDGLWKLKESSDEFLTRLIDEQKKGEQFIKKQEDAELQKRIKTDDLQ